MDETTGERLYQIVEDYCALGEHHRSGTPEGEATIAWFAAELERRGARVRLQPYTFDRFDARWEVRIDGEPVPSIPYFYEGCGRVQTDRPVTGTVPVREPAQMREEFAVWDQRAREAGASAAAVATLSESGELFAHNSRVRPPGDVPKLCISGKLAERLADARVAIEFEAHIGEGHAANVIGEFGSGAPEATVVLTTPLTGWFRCAGERGTGIALLLEVASALAADAPLRVVGTSNHEIPGPGTGHAFFFAQSDGGLPAAKGVFHFGGSSAIAVPDPQSGRRRLNPRFRVAGWLGDARRAELEAAYAPLRRTIESPTDAEAPSWPGWRGESIPWARLSVPLVSHGGRGPYTHTDHDLPDLATSPEVLAAVFACDLAAARLLAR